MNKEQKRKRIKALRVERWFFENYRHQATDKDIINDINKHLTAINNEYYQLLGL